MPFCFFSTRKYNQRRLTIRKTSYDSGLVVSCLAPRWIAGSDSFCAFARASVWKNKMRLVSFGASSISASCGPSLLREPFHRCCLTSAGRLQARLQIYVVVLSVGPIFKINWLFETTRRRRQTPLTPHHASPPRGIKQDRRPLKMASQWSSLQREVWGGGWLERRLF